MRKGLILLVLLAGCSRSAPGGDTSTAQEGPAPQVQKAGVDVAPALAPGVALTYGYDYLLPVLEVARTLEQHAAQCEALGPARCRITGLSYHASPNRTITARLDVKLAPAIARAYGKQATAAVVTAGGMLTDSEITSVEAGATIDRARTDVKSLAGEQADLERQLARSGLPAAERTQLQERLAALRDQARSVAAGASDAAVLLASTPMKLSYQSGTVDAGYGRGPIIGALRDGWANVVSGTAVIVTLVITLLPWLLAIGLAIALFRLGRRWLARWTGGDG